MRKQELGLLRWELERKLDDLTGGPAKARDLIAERSTDPTDEAQSEVSVAVAVRSVNIDWANVKAIEAALDRLRTDDYGICQRCGEPIRAKRLRVIPWATLCVPCQSCQEEADDFIEHSIYVDENVAESTAFRKSEAAKPSAQPAGRRPRQRGTVD